MTSPAHTALPRQLGLLSAMAVLIGTVIGSGIFRTPAVIAGYLPGPLPMLMVWAAGGLFALCGALTIAELSSALPQTGGIYVFLRDAYGRLAAFLFGWSQLIMIRAAALGAIATTFAEYFLRVLAQTVGFDDAAHAQWVHYIAAIAIGVTATFNYVGLRYGSMVQNITTIAKYGGLMFIVIVALALGLPQTGGENFAPATPPGSFAFAAFGFALVSVLWAFDGWADLSFVSGEVKDPRRTLPRALIFGMMAVIFIYALANIGYLAVLSVDEMRESPLVAADVAQRLLGYSGVVFVSATVMISTFGTLNGSILTGPRIFFAMADDRLFFEKVADVHPRYRTPHVAITLSAILGMVFVMVRTFEQLADLFVTGMIPFYALGVGSIFILRKRPDYSPSFRVPLYPIVPILFIIATILLLGNSILDPGERWGTLAVLGAILAGAPVYWWFYGRKREA